MIIFSQTEIYMEWKIKLSIPGLGGGSQIPDSLVCQDQTISDTASYTGGGGLSDPDPSAAVNNPPAFSFFSTPPD